MTSTDRQRAHIDAETVATARPASRRSTSNSNTRGNAETRRRRRRWLVETFRADVDLPVGMLIQRQRGDGTWIDLGVTLGSGVPACRCYRCGRLLDEAHVSPDRIVPGCQGGTYARNNIRPACDLCQMQTGGALGYSRRGK